MSLEGINTILLSLISTLFMILLILIKTVFNGLVKRLDNFGKKIEILGEANISHKKDIENLKDKSEDYHIRLRILETKK